jgi:hypothetical protein
MGKSPDYRRCKFCVRNGELCVRASGCFELDMSKLIDNYLNLLDRIEEMNNRIIDVENDPIDRIGR